MTNSPGNMGSGLPEGGDVSPWWKLWQTNQEWRDNLAKRLAHKSVDIPDDMGDIGSNNTTNNYGGGVKSMLAGAALAIGGMGVGGLLLNHFLDKPAMKPVEKIIEHETVFDSDIEMEVIPPVWTP